MPNLQGCNHLIEEADKEITFPYNVTRAVKGHVKCFQSTKDGSSRLDLKKLEEGARKKLQDIATGFEERGGQSSVCGSHVRDALM